MKRGFTLIEVMAVIIILGIIATISVPVVKDLLNDVRSKAALAAAKNIMEAADITYNDALTRGDYDELTFEYSDGTLSSSTENMELLFKGDPPQEGKLNVNKEGKIYLEAFFSSGVCVVKDYRDVEPYVKETNTIELCYPLPRPIIEATPLGYQKSKVLNFTFPIRRDSFKYYYSLDGGTSFSELVTDSEINFNIYEDIDARAKIEDIVNGELIGQSTYTLLVNDIDTEPPVITFMPNGMSGSSVSATINAIDSESGILSLKYIWTNNLTEPVVGWTNIGAGDVVSKDEVGSWYLHVKAIDFAGNESYVVSNVFEVEAAAPDTIPPNISIVSNEGLLFSGEIATATITIIDDSPLSSKVYAWTTGLCSNVSSWNTLNTDTVTYKMGSVTVSLCIEARDSIGNESTAVAVWGVKVSSPGP